MPPGTPRALLHSLASLVRDLPLRALPSVICEIVVVAV